MPYPEEAGWWETATCWISDSSQVCVDAQRTRINQQISDAEAQYNLAMTQQAVIQAQAGVRDAARQQQYQNTSAMLWTVAPVMIVGIGGLAAFLWWRRQRYQRTTPLSQLSDTELERRIYEAQYAAD